MASIGRLLAVAVFVLPLAAAARADVVNLTPIQDNSLFESATGALSNGSGGNMFAGRTEASGGNALRRALVQFDLSPIPPSATVTAVQVSMTVTFDGPASGGSTVTLQRVLGSWGEGASVAPGPGGTGTAAAPGDATWIHRFSPGTLWATPGGDFSTTISAATPLPAAPTISWSSPGLVVDVQSWLASPSSNFGWILRGEESIPGTGIAFATRENLTVASRPVLTVTFTPVPEPSAVCLACLGGLVVARRLRRRS